MSPAQPWRKMHSAPGTAASTDFRRGPGKSVFQTRLSPPISVGWHAKLATTAIGRPSSPSTCSTGTLSSTGRSWRTRLMLVPGARPVPQPTRAGRRWRQAAYTAPASRSGSDSSQGANDPVSASPATVEPRETLGALWLCAALTSTASGAIPVSRSTRSRTAAVMSAPAKTRSIATIATCSLPSSRTSACPSMGSRIPSASTFRADQQPCGRPDGGVTSTRATPAVRLLTIGPCSQWGHQLGVRLRTPLLEGEPRVLAGLLEERRVELDADPLIVDAGLGTGEHRAVRREDVGAADMGAVPVEPDHVREDGEDAVVPGEDVVEPRRTRARFEQLLLRAQHVLVRQLALAAVEREDAAARGHRPVRVREEDHLGALQREDAPALEEVAVVADRGPDRAEAEVVHAPFVRLPEAEELVVGGVHLPLQPDQAVRPHERRGVVVRPAVELAEPVRDDDPARLGLGVDRAEDPPVVRLGEPGDVRAAVVPRDGGFGEDDQVAARLGGLADQPQVRLQVVLHVQMTDVDLGRGDRAAPHQSSSARSASRAITMTLSPCSVAATPRTTQTIPSVIAWMVSGSRSTRSRKCIRPTGCPFSTRSPRSTSVSKRPDS